MATNPMQRKARNSFLLGMLLMLVISGLIIAFLILQLMNKIKEENETKAASVNAYVLNQDVSSGQVITTDMLFQIMQLVIYQQLKIILYKIKKEMMFIQKLIIVVKQDYI